MNRKQRRLIIKKERPNSKKSFVETGKVEIPISEIHHDENLKECDIEIMELISKRIDWTEQGLIKNDLSKCIVMKGCSYLDSLCSLKFSITPDDDKALIRDTMYYVGNYTNMFYGLLLDEDVEGDITLFKRTKQCIENGEKDINALLVHDLYPMVSLPNKEVIDDIYASFIGEHAQRLSSFLQHTSKNDIEGDEEYIFEVLKMILKKTDELLPQVKVNSKKFIVKM